MTDEQYGNLPDLLIDIGTCRQCLRLMDVAHVRSGRSYWRCDHCGRVEVSRTFRPEGEPSTV
jgi:ribosomal protein L37AE/L43A